MCAAIKQMDVGANVVLITTPAAAEFVRGLGIVDEVVAFDKRGAHRSSAGRGELVASLPDGTYYARVNVAGTEITKVFVKH